MTIYNKHRFYIVAVSLVSSSLLEPQSPHARIQMKARHPNFPRWLPLLAHFVSHGPRLAFKASCCTVGAFTGKEICCRVPAGSSSSTSYWTAKICMLAKPVTGWQFLFSRGLFHGIRLPRYSYRWLLHSLAT
jgi:hypothetical protein